VRIRNAIGGGLSCVGVDGDNAARVSFDMKDLINNVIYVEYDHEGRYYKQFVPLAGVPGEYVV
jgi:hypothetical protein